MKIYSLTSICLDRREIEGLYKTKELAEKRKEFLLKHQKILYPDLCFRYRLQEWEVQEEQ